MPPNPNSKRRLSVEGIDDLHSITNLVERHGIDCSGKDMSVPYVHNAGSVEKVLEAPVWSHAGEATIKAQTLGSHLAEKDLAKGKLYAWLAWQQSPGLPFGIALKARLFGHDSPEALRFVAWFTHLFL